MKRESTSGLIIGETVLQKVVPCFRDAVLGRFHSRAWTQACLVPKSSLFVPQTVEGGSPDEVVSVLIPVCSGTAGLQEVWKQPNKEVGRCISFSSSVLRVRC